MKVAVVGTCQALGVAECLARRLTADCEIASFNVATALRDLGADGLIRSLAEADIVFAHRLPPIEAGDFSLARLEQQAKTLVLFRSLAYSGFHPDMCYIIRQGVKFVGPMGQLHSALIAGAFLAEVPKKRVKGLFNRYIFSRLGYFDYASAFASFDAAFEEIGGPSRMSRLLLGGGAFMHTGNHPHIRVLDALAEILASNIPAEYHRDALGPMPADALSQTYAWPVYKEIAEVVGIDPEPLLFRTPAASIDLDELIELSYLKYRIHADIVAQSTVAIATARILSAELAQLSNAAPPAPAPIAPDYVDALYEVILGRGADPGGKQAHIGKFESLPEGQKFKTLLASFINSPEGRNRMMQLLARSAAPQ